MGTLTLQITDKAKLDAGDLQKFLAAKLYEAGKLTLGQAAGMAGVGKVAFAGILIDHRVSILNYPVSEIKRDAKEYKISTSWFIDSPKNSFRA